MGQEFSSLLIVLAMGFAGCCLYILWQPRHPVTEVLFYVVFASPAALVWVFSDLGPLRAWHILGMLGPVVFLPGVLKNSRFSAILKR